MCIAGVFGGEKSGVKESTTKVFLESAYFNPVDVRKSSKRHALKTDSSYRFERGTDIRAVDYALDRCVEILEEIAGAKVVSKRITAGEKPQDFFDVIFRPAQVKQKLGLEIANEQIAKLLNAMEMDVDTSDSETWNLRVPSYRVDVTREIDVLEDILRIHGYNDVPNQEQFKFALPNISGVQKEAVQTKVSDFLVGKGFNELLNNSLTNGKYGEDLDIVRSDWNVELLNPLSNELAIMRQTLVFGVLESLVRNQNKKQPNNRFFEFGNTYMKVAEQKYIQKSRLAMAISGNLHEEHWSEKVVPVQFYHLMGYVQALMDKLGLPKLKAKSSENNQYDYHVDLKVGKKLIGTIGKISNKLVKKFGMKSDVFYAEFDWDVIVEFASNQSAKFKPLRKFHPVLRDFSLLIDEAIEYQAIENSVYQTERNLLSDVQLFDVYQGDKLPEGKKSYAMRFELYSDEETLKDKQINAIMSKIQSTLEKEFGAELR
jgi:phenylalanyl-tRNA synthetase beta chain